MSTYGHSELHALFSVYALDIYNGYKHRSNNKVLPSVTLKIGVGTNKLADTRIVVIATVRIEIEN